MTLLLITVMIITYNGKNNAFGLRKRLVGLGRNRFCICDPSNIVSNVSAVAILTKEFGCGIPYAVRNALIVIFPGFSRRPIFIIPNGAIAVTNSISRLHRLAIGNAPRGGLVAAFHRRAGRTRPRRVTTCTTTFIYRRPAALTTACLVGHCFVHISSPSCINTTTLCSALYTTRPGGNHLTRRTGHIHTCTTTNVGRGLPTFATAAVSKEAVARHALSGSATIVCL